jgi:hypothetical protein
VPHGALDKERQAIAELEQRNYDAAFSAEINNDPLSRARVMPTKRGRGRKRRQPTGENWLDKTAAERHASMAGFCSCKTDIVAIPGKSLDAAAQACI